MAAYAGASGGGCIETCLSFLVSWFSETGGLAGALSFLSQHLGLAPVQSSDVTKVHTYMSEFKSASALPDTQPDSLVPQEESGKILKPELRNKRKLDLSVFLTWECNAIPVH